MDAQLDRLHDSASEMEISDNLYLLVCYAFYFIDEGLRYAHKYTLNVPFHVVRSFALILIQ